MSIFWLYIHYRISIESCCYFNSRHVAICRTGLYRKYSNVKIAIIVCTCAWLVALGLTIPILVFEVYFYDPVICSCAVDRHKHKVYIVVFACIGVMIPMVMITCCYCCIFRFIQTSRRKLMILMGHYTNSRYRRQVRQTDIDVVKCFMLIFIMLIISWVPGIIVVVFFEKGLPRILYIISYQFALFSSSINCLIYGKTYHRLREGYYQIAFRARKRLCGWIGSMSSSGNENVEMDRFS